MICSSPLSKKGPRFENLIEARVDDECTEEMDRRNLVDEQGGQGLLSEVTVR